MDIKYLTVEDIIRLHDRKCGFSDVRDINLLKFCADAPYQEMYGIELYPSIFDKAAKLAESFAKYQIFIDGNKRTGMISCLTMLKLNGYQLSLTNDELYKLGMKIANDSTYDWKEISKHLESHSIPYEFDYKKIEETLEKE